MSESIKEEVDSFARPNDELTQIEINEWTLGPKRKVFAVSLIALPNRPPSSNDIFTSGTDLAAWNIIIFCNV
jgi:hypothetical protein